MYLDILIAIVIALCVMDSILTLTDYNCKELKCRLYAWLNLAVSALLAGLIAYKYISFLFY